MNIHKYIKNREWREDPSQRRKIEIFDNIQKSKDSKNVIEKLGVVLIYNQLIEQLIKETITVSYAYLTIKLEPKKIRLDLSFKDCTFGRIINKFEQYTIEENNRGLLLKYLKSMNIMRNGLTHQIMEMMDDDVIISVVEGYSDLAEECFYLLIEYYNCIADDIENKITEK